MNTELKLPYIADTLSVAVLRTILSEETIFPILVTFSYCFDDIEL